MFMISGDVTAVVILLHNLVPKEEDPGNEGGYKLPRSQVPFFDREIESAGLDGASVPQFLLH